MNSKYALIILQICFFCNCTKTEVYQLELKGSIKGTVNAHSYTKLTDPSGCMVYLEGSDPLISTVFSLTKT